MPYRRISNAAKRFSPKEFGGTLKFVINNKSHDPIRESVYVGIEIIRLYSFDRNVSSSVYLYRNANWVNSKKKRLPEKRLSGPNLEQFVRDHSRDKPDSLITGDHPEYLLDWHAHTSYQAPSSWNSREKISEGLGLRKNRKGYISEGSYATAQGTYRLIRFYESRSPNARNPLLFDVVHHGAQYLLIRVFQSDSGRAAYQNEYYLELVK